MNARSWWCWLLSSWALFAACVPLAHAQKATAKTQKTQKAQPAPQPAPLSHGLFSGVQVLRPAGTPRQFVLLLSENDAPTETERALTRKMTAAGAMVSVVPLAPFYRRLEAQDGKCTFAAGAFENLARHVQAFEKLPTYLLPIVVGSGRASSFAYGLLAQAPDGTFASALSLDFCPRLMFRTPLCAAHALRWQASADGAVELLPAASLAAPWTAMPSPDAAACKPGDAQAFAQRVAQATWIPAESSNASATPPQVPAAFDAAYAALAAKEQGLAPPPAQLADLPIVEVPADAEGSRFAVLLSGDGGWAGIDKGIAAALAQRGVPVAGFDSLRYFWSARTPEGLAGDLDRIIRYYAARWKRKDVILIGYSQGADVLPFALNRLPARTRSSVRLTALLGLGQKASFEFHVSNWIGTSGDKPIAPEAAKLAAGRTLCLYGRDERDSLCPQLAPAHAQAVPLEGGHHFGGEYGALAARILDAVPQ
ncbi:MAG TPA: AcvB/VirJ family lysyl-phosphatidylglycerol hydrolase [Burkholderiaceae bacterium]|nr:AcvB/VirJ family lysyl-phosphatidylglycerol hydrolase [Burkholderiaceae bacterium]